MITKEDLKDWLAESERKEAAKKIEEYLDISIKNNALSGNLNFTVSTGRYTRDGSRKTKFYDLWHTKDLSEENRMIVQDKIIKKYQKFGFDVKRTSVDCGWSNNFFALEFKNIDQLIADKEEETK